MRKSNKYRNALIQPRQDWEAESDLRTLKEAECIKADPKRMKRVEAVLERERAALKEIAGSLSENA